MSGTAARHRRGRWIAPPPPTDQVGDPVNLYQDGLVGHIEWTGLGEVEVSVDLWDVTGVPESKENWLLTQALGPCGVVGAFELVPGNSYKAVVQQAGFPAHESGTIVAT